MKKISCPIVALLLILSNCINVNAAHQHSENCYVLQEHVHTGSETSGGGCYGVANYHVHSGDSTSGGGCYGAVSRHVHTGDTTSGGGCYGAANYHVHSGDSVNGGGCYGTPVYHVHEGQAGQSSANGCYTRQSSNAGTCTVTAVNTWTEHDGPDMFCSFCNTTWNTYVYTFWLVHSSCGQENQWHPYTHTNCQGCGTLLATNSSKPNPTTHTYDIAVYNLGCGKTEQSVEYYELNCGKTTTTVESYSMNCGKSADTAEGYTLNCGKTPDTVESYSLNCEYQNDTKIRTLICTLGGNAYADSKEIGTERKHKKDCYQEYMWGMKKSREIRQLQPLCFKGI